MRCLARLTRASAPGVVFLPKGLWSHNTRQRRDRLGARAGHADRPRRRRLLQRRPGRGRAGLDAGGARAPAHARPVARGARPELRRPQAVAATVARGAPALARDPAARGRGRSRFAQPRPARRRGAHVRRHRRPAPRLRGHGAGGPCADGAAHFRFLPRRDPRGLRQRAAPARPGAVRRLSRRSAGCRQPVDVHTGIMFCVAVAALAATCLGDAPVCRSQRLEPEPARRVPRSR